MSQPWNVMRWECLPHRRGNTKRTCYRHSHRLATTESCHVNLTSHDLWHFRTTLISLKQTMSSDCHPILTRWQDTVKLYSWHLFAFLGTGGGWRGLRSFRVSEYIEGLDIDLEHISPRIALSSDCPQPARNINHRWGPRSTAFAATMALVKI